MVANHDLEHLFTKDELLAVQRSCYPDANKYSKTQFNRAIQELYIKNQEIELSFATITNFKNVFDFICGKLKND